MCVLALLLFPLLCWLVVIVAVPLYALGWRGMKIQQAKEEAESRRRHEELLEAARR